MDRQRFGVVLGLSPDVRGGMTAVVAAHRDLGLFQRHPLRYLCTYRGPDLFLQARTMLAAFAQLLAWLPTGRVAFLHAHMAARGSFWRKSLLCLLSKCFGVPFVLHIHGGELEEFYYRECRLISQWWVRRTLRSAKLIVCLSDGWKKRLLRIEPAARYTVIGNPVTVPKQIHPLRESPRTILFLGRLRPAKGVFDLVEAIPRVLAVCGPLRFILAGDEDVEGVRRRAHELGVEPAVELPGWVEGADKTRLLAQADIFVLPSHCECLPVSVLEAMAVGVPVIGTTADGIADVVDHEVDGLLVTPGDTAGLADALIRMISDGSLRERLRTAAYARVKERYAAPVVSAEMDSLYERLLSQEPASGGSAVRAGSRAI